MEKIRQLREEELKESLDLSQFAFQYRLTPEEEREQLLRMKPEENWGLFGEQGLEAKLGLLPLHAYVGGRELPVGGIAGVATWPEKRRGGKVASLLIHALGVMRGQGQTLSLLHPFQFEFYRRFGWETYTEYKKYELSAFQIPRYPYEGGRVERTAELGLLRSVYDAYAARFNGMLVRTDEWWEWRILKRKNAGGVSAVYYGADQAPKGYMLYKVADGNLVVNEFVALDAEAQRGLWNYIANHDSMLGHNGRVELRAESGDRLASLLKDPRIKQELVPYFMARLVDAAAFLKGYAFAPGKAGEMQLFIRDPHALWNEGPYTLRIKEDGSAAVEHTETSWERTGPEERAKGLSCSIGILASMLLGYERPAFWYENGMLAGPAADVERLEALIPKRSTFLLDFF